MTTIINTPPRDSHDGGEGMGVGMILGIVITTIVVLVLFYVYGWPALMGRVPEESGGTNINVIVPTPSPTP